MKHLRPHQVFDKIERVDSLATICLPHHHSLTSMLERGILASLLKLIKPRTIFEFGTYLGETTLILASNTKAKVYSIDLDQNLVEENHTYLDDREMANVQRRYPGKLVFQGTQYEHQIETIIANSTTYNFSDFYQRIDFILIDGGHQIDVVESDTRWSFKMLSLEHPACIVWHDYGNPHYKITEYLDDLSSQFELYHVAETGYVFCLANQNLSFD